MSDIVFLEEVVTDRLLFDVLWSLQAAQMLFYWQWWITTLDATGCLDSELL